MNRSCPYCFRGYFDETQDEAFYWHIKVHNAQEEATRLLEEKYKRQNEIEAK